jgi:hypothetical protein
MVYFLYMEKVSADYKARALSIILLFSLLTGLISCKKDHETDVKTTPDQVFSGKYSNTYDKWKLVAIENGFRKKEKAPDFDYLIFTQPGNYEKNTNPSYFRINLFVGHMPDKS